MPAKLLNLNRRGGGNYFVLALILAILAIIFFFAWSIQTQSETFNKTLGALGFPVGGLGALTFIANLFYIFIYAFFAYLVFMILGSLFFSRVTPEGLSEESSWKGYSSLLEMYGNFFDSFFCLHLRKWEAGEGAGLDVSLTDFVTKRLFPFALIYTILFSIPVVNRILEIISLQFIAYLTAWFVSGFIFYIILVLAVMFLLSYLVIKWRSSGKRIFSLILGIISTAVFVAALFGVEYLLKYLGTSSVAIGTKITGYIIGILLSGFVLTLELLVLFVLIPFFFIFWVSLKGIYYNFKAAFYAAPLVKKYRELKHAEEVKRATTEVVIGLESIRKAGRIAKDSAKKK